MTSLFQELISCAVLLINAYCLWIIGRVKELRSFDYFFAIVQTVSDFLLNGFFGFIYAAGDHLRLMEEQCSLAVSAAAIGPI